MKISPSIWKSGIHYNNAMQYKTKSLWYKTSLQCLQHEETQKNNPTENMDLLNNIA